MANEKKKANMAQRGQMQNKDANLGLELFQSSH
jgi:hypothetical protein